MNSFYSQLCNMFIRPTRQTYNKHDLGNPIFCQHGQRFDFQIKNNHNYNIVGSYFRNNQQAECPCVVYLHGFNGSRLESLSYAQKVINIGFSMCSFDFSGTGNSEGQYVSLGHRQQYDILAVIRYLQQHYQIKNYILWGRSMGAVAAIKFYSLLERIKWEQGENLSQIKLLNIILDSPFYSLSQLALQIARNRVMVPQILIKAVFMMIQANIQEKAHFKFTDLEIKNFAKKISCPVLLLASKEDKLISYHHSEKIYEAIEHKDKQIIFIKGEHNDCRDGKTITNLLCFMKNKIKIGRNERHNSCMFSERRLQSYQSSKCLKIIKQEVDESEKIDSTTRIRYFQAHRLTPEPKIRRPVLTQKKSTFKTRQGDLRVFNQLFMPYERKQPLEKKRSQANIHQLHCSEEIVIKGKRQDGINHMNIINEKLRKKKKVDRNQQLENRKRNKMNQEFISIKSIEEIQPKTPMKTLSKKIDYSYSQKIKFSS